MQWIEQKQKNTYTRHVSRDMERHFADVHAHDVLHSTIMRACVSDADRKSCASLSQPLALSFQISEPNPSHILLARSVAMVNCARQRRILGAHGEAQSPSPLPHPAQRRGGRRTTATAAVRSTEHGEIGKAQPAQRGDARSTAAVARKRKRRGVSSFSFNI